MKVVWTGVAGRCSREVRLAGVSGAPGATFQLCLQAPWHGDCPDAWSGSLSAGSSAGWPQDVQGGGGAFLFAFIRLLGDISVVVAVAWGSWNCLNQEGHWQANVVRSGGRASRCFKLLCRPAVLLKCNLKMGPT